MLSIFLFFSRTSVVFFYFLDQHHTKAEDHVFSVGIQYPNCVLSDLVIPESNKCLDCPASPLPSMSFVLDLMIYHLHLHLRLCPSWCHTCMTRLSASAWLLLLLCCVMAWLPGNRCCVLSQASNGIFAIFIRAHIANNNFPSCSFVFWDLGRIFGRIVVTLRFYFSS